MSRRLGHNRARADDYTKVGFSMMVSWCKSRRYFGSIAPIQLDRNTWLGNGEPRKDGGGHSYITEEDATGGSDTCAHLVSTGGGHSCRYICTYVVAYPSHDPQHSPGQLAFLILSGERVSHLTL
jgi:hypothetical protein